MFVFVCSIWNHLIKLVSSGQTTVIITTHNLEEANQSTMIGLMRNGKLLEEDTPENLFKTHCTTRLEEIVLKLCLLDTKMRNEQNNVTHAPTTQKMENVILSSTNNINNNDNGNNDEPSYVSTKKNNSTITYGNNPSGIVCQKYATKNAISKHMICTYIFLLFPLKNCLSYV